MKRLVLFAMFVTGFPLHTFGQNCGQGTSTDRYMFVVVGMDDVQGGSQVEGNPQQTASGSYRGDLRVINGYDYQYKVVNPSDQTCGIDLFFGLNVQNGRSVPMDFFKRLEGTETMNRGDFSGFAIGDMIIRPNSRVTRTLTMAPGAHGLFTGWARVRQDGDYERLLTVGTVRLYQGGEVISQFSMKPVEARLTNFVQVFGAERDNQRTGVAIGNPLFENVEVIIQLFDVNGVELGRRSETIGPYGNFAQFVNELFPNAIENSSEWNRVFESDGERRQVKVFSGTIKITSTKEVPVTAIDGRVSLGRFLMSLSGAN